MKLAAKNWHTFALYNIYKAYTKRISTIPAAYRGDLDVPGCVTPLRLRVMLWPSKWVSLCSNPSNAYGGTLSGQAHSYCETTNLVDTDSFHPVQACFFPPKSTLVSSTAHPQDHITGFPIGALISLALKHNFVAFWTTLVDLQGKVGSVVQDFSPVTVRTHFLDDLPSPPAVAACCLGLSEHAWEYLLFHEPDPSTVA